MPAIRAIVFDSNAFGRDALPNSALVERWAEVCADHDSELWVPEVVAYELAQHAVQLAQGEDAKLRTYNEHRLKWGLTPIPLPPPVLVENVLNVLESAGAIIIELNSEDARAAVLDQVLQTGAGSRKSGVKTGAADSAWIRSVITHNDGTLSGLVVVTGDERALVETCSELCIELPPRAAHVGELYKRLGGSIEASPELLHEFETWVDMNLGVDAPIGNLERSTEIGGPRWWDVREARTLFPGWQRQGATIQEIIEVEVVGEVRLNSWTQSLNAALRIAVGVIDRYSRQDSWGNQPEHVSVFYEGGIEAELTLFIENDGLVFTGSLENVNFVEPNHVSFIDS